MMIEVDEKVATTLKRLEAEAAARQMPLDTFLDLVIRAAPARCDPIELVEFDAILDELAEHTASHTPLPLDFSRADIYSDHD